MLDILIAGDIKLYTEGLETLLGKDTRVKVIGIAATLKQALRITAEKKPSIVLLDLSMAQSLDLIDQGELYRGSYHAIFDREILLNL